MPTREGKTQIQVDIKTRKRLRILRDSLGMTTYDELLNHLIDLSGTSKIVDVTVGSVSEFSKGKPFSYSDDWSS